MRGALQRVEPELAVGIEKNVLGVGRPMICGYMVAGTVVLLAVILGVGLRGLHGRQFLRGHQHRRFSGGHVNVVELGILSLLVMNNVRDLGAVRAPLDGVWRAAGKTAAAAAVNGFYREFLWLLPKARSGKKK